MQHKQLSLSFPALTPSYFCGAIKNKHCSKLVLDPRVVTVVTAFEVLHVRTTAVASPVVIKAHAARSTSTLGGARGNRRFVSAEEAVAPMVGAVAAGVLCVPRHRSRTRTWR